MKTRIFLLTAIIALVFLSACKKDDSGPLLEGNFSGSFYLGGDLFPFYFNDVEQDGERLYGSFQFTDGSGYGQFGSTSKLVEDDLHIKFTVSEGGYSMTFAFEGTVNPERTEMNGSNLRLTLGGVGYVDCGAWSATKSGSGAGNEKSAVGSQLDLLLKAIQKNSWK